MSTFYAQKRSESDFMFKNHMIDWIFDSNEDACDKKIEYQQFISSNNNLTKLNLRLIQFEPNPNCTFATYCINSSLP